MSAPVKYTCPDIDAILESLREVAESLDYFDKNIDPTEIGEAPQALIDDLDIQNLRYILESQEGALEDLRRSNASLRDWGTEEEERAGSAESKLEDAQAEIEDLTQEKDRLQSEIYVLREENEALRRELEDRPVINPPRISEIARLNS